MSLMGLNQNAIVKTFKWSSLLSYWICLLMVSASVLNAEEKPYTAVLLDQYFPELMADILSAIEQLRKVGSPESSHYVFVGRSLPPMRAILEFLEPGSSSFLPLSSVRYIPGSVASPDNLARQLSQTEEGVLFAWLALHLDAALQKKKIVLVDCSVSGRSLRGVSLYLKEYLAEKGI